MKLELFFEPYLEHCINRGRSENTVEEHRRIISNILRETVGHLRVDELKVQDIDRIIVKAEEYGVSMPKRAVITLRRLLKFARDCGHQTSLYWRDIEVPKYVVRKPVDRLTDKEIEQIRDVLSGEGERDLLFRALFELILHTGLRISEALSVNISDLRLEEEELIVRNVKTQEVEEVYIHGATPYLERYLAIRTDFDPALFFSPVYRGRGGYRLTVDAAKSKLNRIARDAGFGVRKIGWHILRKTYCTLLLERGANVKQVQHFARHKSEITTMRYYFAVDKKKAKRVHKRIMTSV